MPQWIDPSADPEGAITQLQNAWDQVDGRVVVIDGRVDQNRDLLQKIRDWIRGVRRGRIGGLDGERATKLHSHTAEELIALDWLRKERSK